jgi:hypothetical protein
MGQALSDRQRAFSKLFLGASSQFAIQSFDRSVAFAGARFERGAIKDRDPAATVFDGTSVM